MARSVFGVILGYLAMVVIVFIALTGSFLALGVDRVFLPGSYNVTLLWLLIMTVFSLIAAIVGGWVCAAIAKKEGAVTGLIIMVVVLGILSAIPAQLDHGPKPARNGDVPNLQAMTNGMEPAWYSFLLPIIGAAGVWIGSRPLARPRAQDLR
jgi:hypothetical protein